MASLPKMPHMFYAASWDSSEVERSHNTCAGCRYSKCNRPWGYSYDLEASLPEDDKKNPRLNNVLTYSSERFPLNPCLSTYCLNHHNVIGFTRTTPTSQLYQSSNFMHLRKYLTVSSRLPLDTTNESWNHPLLKMDLRTGEHAGHHASPS